MEKICLEESYYIPYSNPLEYTGIDYLFEGKEAFDKNGNCIKLTQETDPDTLEELGVDVNVSVFYNIELIKETVLREEEIISELSPDLLKMFWSLTKNKHENKIQIEEEE